MTPIPILLGVLCVECGACSRRVMFRSAAGETAITTPDLARRFKCSACGAKRPVLFRARDEHEAKRWFAER